MPACPECGSTFEQGHLGRPKKFCSQQCNRRVQNRKANRRRLPAPIAPERTCIDATCGKVFEPGRRDQVYCSPRCRVNDGQRRRWHGEELRQGAEFERTCVECGNSFVARKANAKWCSQTCRIRTCRRDESRRRGPGSTEDAPYVDREIFERDGWRCHLCRKLVKKGAPRNDPDGASIDHIVPRSEGGADAPHNVATAHLRCNLRKGVRAMNEQLRLI